MPGLNRALGLGLRGSGVLLQHVLLRLPKNKVGVGWFGVLDRGLVLASVNHWFFLRKERSSLIGSKEAVLHGLEVSAQMRRLCVSSWLWVTLLVCSGT